MSCAPDFELFPRWADWVGGNYRYTAFFAKISVPIFVVLLLWSFDDDRPKSVIVGVGIVAVTALLFQLDTLHSRLTGIWRVEARSHTVNWIRNSKQWLLTLSAEEQAQIVRAWQEDAQTANKELRCELADYYNKWWVRLFALGHRHTRKKMTAQDFVCREHIADDCGNADLLRAFSPCARGCCSHSARRPPAPFSARRVHFFGGRPHLPSRRGFRRRVFL